MHVKMMYNVTTLGMFILIPSGKTLTKQKTNILFHLPNQLKQKAYPFLSAFDRSQQYLSVLVRVLIAVKHHDHKQLGEKGLYFVSTSTS